MSLLLKVDLLFLMVQITCLFTDFHYRSSTVTVLIQILDVNDNCPEFPSSLSGYISSQDIFVLTTNITDRLILEAEDKDIVSLTVLSIFYYVLISVFLCV